MVNLHDVIEWLKMRSEELAKIISEKSRAVANAPEGGLRPVRSGNAWQFFHRLPEKGKASKQNRNGIYIPKKNLNLVKELGQKEYDMKVLRSAKKEYEKVEALREAYTSDTAEAVYENTPESYRCYVQPIKESDEDYVRNWLNRDFNSNPAYKEKATIPTMAGELVRSKSESMIANELYRFNIPYHYEEELYLDGYDFVYPDFTLLNVMSREVFYWEHCGMMANETYVRKNLKKIEAYVSNGILPGKNLILTFETGTEQLNMLTVYKYIGEYFDCDGARQAFLNMQEALSMRLGV